MLVLPRWLLCLMNYGEHVNLLGRYSFALNEALANGDLRPFRDPDAPETSDLWP